MSALHKLCSEMHKNMHIQSKILIFQLDDEIVMTLGAKKTVNRFIDEKKQLKLR
jgi:hypothetical protein